jgi:hypothetical protein
VSRAEANGRWFVWARAAIRLTSCLGTVNDVDDGVGKHLLHVGGSGPRVVAVVRALTFRMIIVGEVFFRSGTIVCRDSTARFLSRKGNGFAAEDADIVRLAFGKASTTFCSMTRIDSSSTYLATARWNTLAGIMVCAMVGVGRR